MLGIVMKYSTTTPQTLPQQPPQQQEMLARFDASPNTYFSSMAYIAILLHPIMFRGGIAKKATF